MLKEQVVAMVEKTLTNTAPGKAFTVAVMASTGVAIKSTGVAAATATTGTSITAVMSGVTAKVITAAAVVAIAVGVVSAYKRLSQPDQPLTQTNEVAAVEDRQEPLVAPENTETVSSDVVDTAAHPIDTPKIQTATMPIDPVVAEAPETEPAPLSQTTDVAGSSDYIFTAKGVLSGLITDKDTGTPVVGAEIVVYGAFIRNGTLVTDVNGFYSLETIDNSKPYKISVKSKDEQCE